MSDKDRQAQLRYRARTDLYWLATEILGLEDLVERVHRPVADHFYKMVPGIKIADVSTEKGMSLFDPRGHFKTSLMQASAVQWLLNYPNIRIFFLAGKLDRASDSLMVVKRAFQHNPKLRALFPEFCPPEEKDWGTTTEFTLPNRTNHTLVDSSLVAYSLDAIKAGPHCDVMFIDDAVHQDNIGTPEQLINVINRFIFMRSIVEPYGYIHVIGTPYSDSDLYAWLEEPENGFWLRKFRRPAWIITNPAYVPGTPLVASDVTLLFPERFSFDYLNSIRTSKEGEFIFNCQYLLDPTPIDTATLTEALLESHRIPHHHIPKTGSVFQTWDLGFSEKKRADFSAGVTGLFDTKGNLFIMDIVLDRYSPNGLVQMIAAMAIKWRPRRIGIENAGGSNLIGPALDNIQRLLGKNFGIEWIPTSPTKHKPERIMSLHPLAIQHKIYFSNAIPQKIWDEIKKQFTKFPRYSHDDGPDAISMLYYFMSRIDIIPDNDQYAEDDVSSVMYDTDADNLLGAGIVG